MPIVKDYRRGLLDKIALAQIQQDPEIPISGLAVAAAEDLTPQALQVVLFDHTQDHLWPNQIPVQSQDQLDQAENVSLEDFPVLGWLGDQVASY